MAASVGSSKLMAFESQDTQAHLWNTQQDGIETQMGGLFYNLDTQDALPEFQEPAKVAAAILSPITLTPPWQHTSAQASSPLSLNKHGTTCSGTLGRLCIGL